MSKIKGIILAGGHGTRLLPLTYTISKHLLPVYDKPMIYYPISTLMNAGITDILIISTKKDISRFEYLLKDGNQIGLTFTYAVQENPNGIAESLRIGSDFIDNDDVVLILGDNIFYGKNFQDLTNKAVSNLNKGFSSVFVKKVDNPNQFGVVNFNNDRQPIEIIEKPSEFISDKIVTGLYFYKNNVKNFIKKLKPSDRNEYEITDLNNIFLKNQKLKLIYIDETISWLDTGTYNSLIKASKYFQSMEEREGKKIACIEEIAFKNKLINKDQFIRIAKSMKSSEYGKYLLSIINL